MVGKYADIRSIPGSEMFEDQKYYCKKNMSKKSIVILASGAGSNARNIIGHFKSGGNAEVVLIASNKKDAGVLDIAAEYGIETYILNRENFLDGHEFRDKLMKLNPDLIVLAGFLLKIPKSLTDAFPDRIINIHPALLPKYGGKGMYGHHVHEAVFHNKEKESGITIHYVNEFYDEGKIIFQAKTIINTGDTAETIEQKVRSLEKLHFPEQIEKLLSAELKK